MNLVHEKEVDPCCSGSSGPWGLILIHVCSLLLGTGWAEPAKSTDERRIVTIAPVVTEGLENPLFLTQTGDGSGRLFIVEQPGRIRVLEGHTLLPPPFLDIIKQVLSGGERDLLGLAFHPPLSEARVILKTSLQISSFGEDAAGELYVLDHKEGVHRLTPP